MSAIEDTALFEFKDLRRKTNRHQALEAIREIAAKHDALVESDEHGRDITVHVRLPGAFVMIHLEGDSRVGAFLGHWNVERGDKRNFIAGFQSPYQSRPNHQATTCEYRYDVFLAKLNAGLRKIKSGAAFHAA